MGFIGKIVAVLGHVWSCAHIRSLYWASSPAQSDLCLFYHYYNHVIQQELLPEFYYLPELFQNENKVI